MIARFNKKTTILLVTRFLTGRRSWLASLTLFLALSFVSLPQPAEAQQLREELERIYRGSVSAMVSKNYNAWKQYTAKSRRIWTHNLVVSQKQRWPEAMFDLPISMPEIGTLGHLETLVNGDTAHLIYYGKVDFGVMRPSDIPNNILMLKFIKEEDGWMFDNTRFFNLADTPEIAHQAGLHDLSFLNDPQFQPTGTPPPVVKPITPPDYVGEIWIAAIGYEVDVKLGNLHEATVRNNLTTDVVMGGLWRDGRDISIAVTELEVEEGVERRVEVAIYAFPPGQKGKRVWHWKPDLAEIPPSYRSKVWANAVTLR